MPRCSSRRRRSSFSAASSARPALARRSWDGKPYTHQQVCQTMPTSASGAYSPVGDHVPVQTAHQVSSLLQLPDSVQRSGSSL